MCLFVLLVVQGFQDGINGVKANLANKAESQSPLAFHLDCENNEQCSGMQCQGTVIPCCIGNPVIQGGFCSCSC